MTTCARCAVGAPKTLGTRSHCCASRGGRRLWRVVKDEQRYSMLAGKPAMSTAPVVWVHETATVRNPACRGFVWLGQGARTPWLALSRAGRTCPQCFAANGHHSYAACSTRRSFRAGSGKSRTAPNAFGLIGQVLGGHRTAKAGLQQRSRIASLTADGEVRGLRLSALVYCGRRSQALCLSL